MYRGRRRKRGERGDLGAMTRETLEGNASDKWSDVACPDNRSLDTHQFPWKHKFVKI